MQNSSDLTGQRFGRLIATHPARKAGQRLKWFCECDCGGTIVTLTHSLTSGRTKSCGCYRREETGKRGKASKGVPPTHGHTRNGKWTPEYNSWAAMNQRCSDPNYRQYKYYGGREIKVAEEWRGKGGFQNFLNHIGPRPEPKRLYSIDRIDPDGDYRPGNVRWATRAEQTRNRR